MTPSRTEAFSDGVFSIAATLALAVYYLVEPVPSEIGERHEHPATDIKVGST